MITGYVRLENLWAPYTYEEGKLTVFKNNHIKHGNNGIYYPPKFEYISKTPYLVGNINGTSQFILFFTRISLNDFILQWMLRSIEVSHHLILGNNTAHFDHLILSCPELDYFFHTKHAIKRVCYSGDPTKKNSENNPDEPVPKFNFEVDGKKVEGSLFIENLYNPTSKTPIELETRLKLSFEQTNDIDFILDLCFQTHKFFSFVCHRTNARFSKISYASSELCINEWWNNPAVEADPDDLQKTPEYILFEPKISELFNFITSGKCYIEHLPENSNEFYNIGRVISLTSAFEWNALLKFQEGLFLDIPQTSTHRQEVIEDILDFIDKAFLPEKNYTSKEKSHFNFILEQIRKANDPSLSCKIKFALEKYGSIIDPFIQELYKLNNQDFTFHVMAERLSEHRNLFAHGNIKEKIKDLLPLDLTVLEWLNYCIMLRHVGYTEEETRAIIKAVFHLNQYTQPTEPINEDNKQAE